MGGMRINDMQPDYQDAAERHWEDACYLSEDNRSANADQLFGLSTECALKAVMQGLGMPLRPDGVPMDKKHRIHVNTLWDEFSAFAHSRNEARYATDIDTKPNPFDTWDVAQRYCHRSEITQTILEKHRQGALITIEILRTAVIDGVVS
jgi:hypothetical protein